MNKAMLTVLGVVLAACGGDADPHPQESVDASHQNALVSPAAQSVPLWICAPGYRDLPGTVPYDMPAGPLGNAFSCGHSGQDFTRANATAIKAVTTGIVVERGWEYTDASQKVKGCHGKYIVVKDGQGVFSAYAHLSDVSTKYPVGSTVKRGEIIAYSGNTGNASACGVSSIGHHLHLSIAYKWQVTAWGAGWQTAEFTNPVTYISKH